MVARNEVLPIHADEKGIMQTNGFFTQSGSWEQVDFYYLQYNKRWHTDRPVEPVMFDVQGEKVFHGFAHLLVSTPPIVKQRRVLWQFVESQLEGKKREAPSPDLDPAILAARELYVDWTQKDWKWKVRRVLFLVAYASSWCVFWMGLIFYLENKTNHNGWALVLLILLVGSPVPFLIWLQFKKRKITRELKDHRMSR